MTDHSDDPQAPASDQQSPRAEDLEPAGSESPPSRSRRRPLLRAIRNAMAILVAIVAAAFVTVFTIDLGPELRGRAEREGSKFIERPMHIGRLSAKLRPGVFVIEDLVIEGLTPQDR